MVLYRNNAAHWQKEYTISAATTQAAVDEIIEGNKRNERIIVALNNIEEAKQNSAKAIRDLENRLNEVATTNVCSTSPAIDATRQWLREQANPTNPSKSPNRPN